MKLYTMKKYNVSIEYDRNSPDGPSCIDEDIYARSKAEALMICLRTTKPGAETIPDDFKIEIDELGEIMPADIEKLVEHYYS